MPQLELRQLPQLEQFSTTSSNYGRVELRQSMWQRDKGPGTRRFLKPCSNPKTELRPELRPQLKK